MLVYSRKKAGVAKRFSHHSFLGCATLATMIITNDDLLANYNNSTPIRHTINADGEILGIMSGLRRIRYSTTSGAAFGLIIAGNHGGTLRIAGTGFTMGTSKCLTCRGSGLRIASPSTLDRRIGGNRAIACCIATGNLGTLASNPIAFAFCPSLRCDRFDTG